MNYFHETADLFHWNHLCSCIPGTDEFHYYHEVTLWEDPNGDGPWGWEEDGVGEYSNRIIEEKDDIPVCVSSPAIFDNHYGCINNPHVMTFGSFSSATDDPVTLGSKYLWKCFMHGCGNEVPHPIIDPEHIGICNDCLKLLRSEDGRIQVGVH